MPGDFTDAPQISDRVHRAIERGDERLPPELVNELRDNIAAFYEHQRRQRAGLGIEPVRDPFEAGGPS